MTIDKYLDIVADTWLDMYLGNSLPSGGERVFGIFSDRCSKNHKRCKRYDSER